VQTGGNVSESLVFVLPDGRSAQIPPPCARLICDRLWDLGITPGAVQAAARISEALHTHPVYWRDVAFSEREVPPLLEASNVAPPVWDLARTKPPLGLPDGVRAHLLDICDGLIDALNARDDQTKLRALSADLERLRGRLSAE